MYDTSLLDSPSKHPATLLCTDDAADSIPESHIGQEASIAKRFKCQDPFITRFFVVISLSANIISLPTFFYFPNQLTSSSVAHNRY